MFLPLHPALRSQLRRDGTSLPNPLLAAPAQRICSRSQGAVKLGGSRAALSSPSPYFASFFFFLKSVKAKESQNSTKEETMKSNNQMGIPLPFYWSQIPVLHLLSLFPAVLSHLTQAGKGFRLRPKPKHSSELHSGPAKTKRLI